MPDKDEEKFEFINLEKSLISSFFQDRKMWVDLKDHIDPNYFNDKNVSKIFQILKIYFNRYKDFPNKDQIKYLATKKSFDKDGFKAIEEIYAKKHMELSEIDFLREETNYFIKNSKLERAIMSSVNLLEKKDYSQIYNLITDAVHWNPDINLGTDYSNAVKRYAVLDELITDVVETPWESLNHFLSGGFYKKELYLFVASSSVGKSIALDQVALHSWDKLGMNVAVITFEMSEERKGQRMDACKFGIPVTEVYNEKGKVINSFENNKRKNKLFIKELPQTATATDIEQYLYQVKLYENIDIDLLVVDYMDIMSPKRARVNEYLDQGTVGADLRDLAKQLFIPVISACLGLDTEIETKERGKLKTKDVKVGEHVLSKNNIYNKVLDKQFNSNTDLYEITTKSGKKIICSENHVFPTDKGETTIKKGLKKGSKLFIKKNH